MGEVIRSTSLLDHPMVTRETWDQYTAADHDRWSRLFKRQTEILKNRACDEILESVSTLHINDKQIPKFSEINEILQKATDFSVIPVTGLIPEELFFRFLVERKFPSTCFIRREDQIDYLQEPDVFHDVYGHVPLLVNPIFANFMEEFGRKGLEAIKMGLYSYAASLYWFTVEFGLIQTKKGLRIYGAGITSSKGESIYCVDSPEPNRFQFDPIRAMKTKYRIDRFQKSYFVIDDYNEIFQALRNIDWKEIKDTLAGTPDIEEGIVVNSDKFI